MRHTLAKSRLFILALLFSFLGSSAPILAFSQTSMIRVSPLKVGQSRWVVCAGNPINCIDPDGLEPDTINGRFSGGYPGNEVRINYLGASYLPSSGTAVPGVLTFTFEYNVYNNLKWYRGSSSTLSVAKRTLDHQLRKDRFTHNWPNIEATYAEFWQGSNSVEDIKVHAKRFIPNQMWDKADYSVTVGRNQKMFLQLDLELYEEPSNGFLVEGSFDFDVGLFPGSQRVKFIIEPTYVDTGANATPRFTQLTK